MKDDNPYKSPNAPISAEPPRTDFAWSLRREGILEEVRNNLYPRTRVQQFVIGIIVASAAGMAAFAQGRPAGIPIALCGLVGIIGLAVYYPRPGYRLVGAVSGFLVGGGMVFATIAYVAFASAMSRTWIANAELAIPFVVGGAPGFIVYYLLATRKALREALHSPQSEPSETDRSYPNRAE